MMPTLGMNYVSDAVIGAVPTLSLAFPLGLELVALVPIGFAAGLAAWIQYTTLRRTPRR